MAEGFKRLGIDLDFLVQGRNSLPPMQAIRRQSLTPEEAFKGILSDPEVRRRLRNTLKGFGLLYFSHHLYLAPGDHHDPMIAALEDESVEFLEIVGFRGSSKTTWGSLITPTFFALEKAQEYGVKPSVEP